MITFSISLIYANKFRFNFFLAVFHAIHFDGSSGGVCRVGVITKDGIEREVFFAEPEPLPLPSEVRHVPAVSGLMEA